MLCINACICMLHDFDVAEAGLVIIIFVALALIFVRITYEDLFFRLVYRRDLILLLSLRIFVILLAYCEQDGSAGLWAVDRGLWGARAFVASLFLAFITLLGVWAVSCIARLFRIAPIGDDALIGRGDIQLYAICCLFLSSDTWFLFLTSSALLGGFLALWWFLIYKQRTFPFAPAIVWSCYIAVLLNALDLP